MLSVRKVVLYSADGCHLCERARATVLEVQRDTPFDLAEVDITGDAELESRYRELLPVVEIDGRRAFVYHVPEAGLRTRLAAQTTSESRGL